MVVSGFFVVKIMASYYMFHAVVKSALVISLRYDEPTCRRILFFDSFCHRVDSS